MRGMVVVVLMLWAVGLVSTLSQEAAAADFYANRKLVPGADAGTTALLQLSDGGVGPGSHFMMNCADYSGVTYRICELATCTATADDKKLFVNRDTDICGVSNHNWLSVFKVYDGGNPTCRLYRVTPQSKDCQP